MLPFKEVRVLDINSEHLGVPMDALMDNAGEATAEVILTEIGTGKKIAVVCGVGNNAGDGFVAARNLTRHNDVTVLLAHPPSEIRTESAKRAYERVKHIASSSVGVPLSKFDVIVDALLGTGNYTEVREPYRTLINRINGSKTTVVSIDVPSGLGTGLAVEPDITVTFTEMKEGMTPENSGKIFVQDIGIPADAHRYVGPGEFAYYPIRGVESHKGQNGRILVIGGGPFTGAPALAGLAAYRMGVDLVHIATPAPSFGPISSYSPNLIVHGLADQTLNAKDIKPVQQLIGMVDAVLIGPGLGLGRGTQEAVRKIVKACDKPLVIDADAIAAVAEDLSVLEGKTAVITPHAKEFETLTGESLPKDLEERAKAVEEAARKLGVVLLAKGHIDVVSDGHLTKLNLTGNPGMSVGGTGDVLAGEVVALLSKGTTAYNAARISAFTNGKAGDLAFEKLGYSLMATDVIDNVPEVLRRYLKRVQ